MAENIISAKIGAHNGQSVRFSHLPHGRGKCIGRRSGQDEAIWLTQKRMAELFGVQTPAISKHLKIVFEEGELQEGVVVSKMEITTPHGAIQG